MSIELRPIDLEPLEDLFEEKEVDEAYWDSEDPEEFIIKMEEIVPVRIPDNEDRALERHRGYREIFAGWLK